MCYFYEYSDSLSGSALKTENSTVKLLATINKSHHLFLQVEVVSPAALRKPSSS